MTKEDIRKLLDRYSKGLCSLEERKQVEHYILKNPITGKWQWKDKAHRALIEGRIRSGLPMLESRPRVFNTRMLWKMTAAVAVLILFFGIWFFKPEDTLFNTDHTVIAEAKIYADDEVTLTLPDGQVHILDRKISVEDLQAISAGSNEENPADIWFTIQVPSRKNQEVVLADGSSVWLNAGSILRFPKVFSDEYRQVYLEGEGYFEIARDLIKPFQVFAGKGQIKVTGTKFNVQAYNDQSVIRTSLVEGGVNFYINEQEHRLTSGIELITNVETGATIRQKFDINQIISWKEGYFTFDNSELVDVMKMVARWYNVTVVSDIQLHNASIGGTYPTDLSLEELLEDLSMLSKAQFKIRGKEVHIVQ